MLALAAFMVARDGGFAGTIWYPVSLVVLAVLATIVASAGRLMTTVSRGVMAAAGCFTAFTLWSFATIGWAAVRGEAWYGSNRGLFYLLVFVLLASWPVTGGALWPLLLAASLVTAIEGVVTVEQTIHASDPSLFLIGSRLSEPLGYPNATAALFMTMVWLMIGLASRPWLPAPARGLACGLAGLHLTLSLLAESRGSVYTLPLVVAAYLILVPGRLRSLAILGLVSLGFAPLIRPVLAVYGTDPSQVAGALRHAIELSFVWAGLLVIAGWIFAAIDDRIHPSRRSIRAATVATITAALLATGGFLGVVQPWQYLGSAWHSFRYSGEPGGSASHFGGLGSNRYDFWRVGLMEFERHPIAGIGTDNFLVPYLQLRRSSEQPIYPHSLPIRLLSQTGLVGSALFLSFLAFVLAVATRIPAGRERDLALVLVAGATVWLFHGLVDWLWEMPVLGVLAMALLGGACGLAPRRQVGRTTMRKPTAVAAIALAGVIATIALGSTLAFPWIAERDVQQAAAVWRDNPSAAFSLLHRAGTLNPLDNEPDLIAGAIASRLHRYTVMRARFQDAVGRSRDDWYANLELGIAASLTGHRQLAASSLERALELDPGEPIIRTVVRTFKSGRRINSDAVDRAFASENG